MPQLHFCSESNDLLVPRENKQQKRLEYVCKTCGYSEAATDSCIYRNVVHHSQEEKTIVKSDVRSDPALPRTREQTCPRCESNEAVYFSTATSEGMNVFYQCMACSHRWQDNV